MKQCTWKSKEKPRCEAEATHEQVANDGSIWANLCDEHHSLMDSVIGGKDVPKMLGYWVCAQGGPKAAAGRMVR